ncbi:endonuclease domain-containing protein [Leptolyngbya sp. AN02str]|uniref:endonuclease domain-containing protein n=1 Tax=Leptolyngbya sp. AN02str TaxID=3423363 RepID=UPI003D31DDF2
MDAFPTVLFPDPAAIAIAPAGLSLNPARGHAEHQFERDLWQFFPGKIQTGLELHRPGFRQPYRPDFAYVDGEQHLFMDIEVDEPYAHVSRKPLHYLGCPKDRARNQWFLAAGWVVIRFSERQVVRSPASCCKTVASAIAHITGNSYIMNPFRNVPTLKPERRWTQAEATNFAAHHDREQYLSNLTEGLHEQAQDIFANAKLHLRQRSKQKQQANQAESIHERSGRQKQPKFSVTSQFTFYCPQCGEGPIRWQGHYVCCPTCRYDAFVL